MLHMGLDILARLLPFGDSDSDSDDSESETNDEDGGFIRSRLDASVMFGHGYSTREIDPGTDDEHTEQLESVKHERR